MIDDSTTNTGSNQADITQSVGLPDLMAILSSHKLCLAGWLIVSLGLGAAYSFQAQPTYKVGSRVLVQAEGSPLSDGNSPRHEKEFLATQGEIISSPAVVERAVTSMKQPLTIEPGVDPVLAVLAELTVKPLSGTNVLSVAYRCKKSEEGISLVQAILDSYEQFLQDMNNGSRLETLQMLTRSEEQLRSDLENREQRYRELRKQSPLIGQGKDASLQMTMLEKLGQTLNEIRNRRIDFQNRMASLGESSETRLAVARANQRLTAVAVPGPPNEEIAERARWTPAEDALPPLGYNNNIALDLIADVKLTGTPSPGQIFEELYRAEVRQKELAQLCGKDHPEMRSAQQRIAAWKEQLHGLNEQAPIALQREIDSALRREKQLAELYNTELQKAKGSDDFLVIEKQELDGIERLKTMHNSLVFQLNDWRLVEPGEDGGWGTKMSIIEAPTIGSGPVWPKLSIVLLLSAAIGLLGAIGTIAVLERETWANAEGQRSADA